ncbi:hypothetical protein BRADI_3g21463v3 [Brachypodium distachyon]|uniref:Uncharacterized protein n=1 Tax=Brachypodium distachyon TaxID=15368 RepID=A0A2K2CYN6_BRADI|nr:hypothetical protein BRADI_3g21463v3 [Brachypodium distachyon]PNT67143.1 hypothetical protein BRADI_3g21463v3 [Brachypodium distachyon]
MQSDACSVTRALAAQSIPELFRWALRLVGVSPARCGAGGLSLKVLSLSLSSPGICPSPPPTSSGGVFPRSLPSGRAQSRSATAGDTLPLVLLNVYDLTSDARQRLSLLARLRRLPLRNRMYWTPPSMEMSR